MITDGRTVPRGKTLTYDFCIIGAGCLVMQGMKIPDHSFVVGSPGKIKGQPTKKQLWWVEEGFKGYAELARNYKNQGL